MSKCTRLTLDNQSRAVPMSFYGPVLRSPVFSVARRERGLIRGEVKIQNHLQQLDIVFSL